MPGFAELHALSNFTFLRGASRPEELVMRAAELAYSAIAITDECSFAGIVKAHVMAKQLSIKLIIGSEFNLFDKNGETLSSIKTVLLAPNRSAYSEISSLISRARRRSEKGAYKLFVQDLQFGTQQCLAIILPKVFDEQEERLLSISTAYFKNRVWLGVELLQDDDDQQHYSACQQLALQLKIPMLACNNVHMHNIERKPLQDVVTAIRLNTSVQELGEKRLVNSECHLRSLDVLQSIYPQELLEETGNVADLCNFSLSELQYEYPEELVPKGKSPSNYLRELTMAGVKIRWPNGISPEVEKQINYELKIIAELHYEHYFLTVYDVVKFAREQKILCQGRGSAANSAVCYCLFITEVNPAQSSLLFERFISKERNEPPDIDVDFEHERREEVIQYIYNKYSRKRAALTATVITYRPRSAIRDVGKAFGFDDILIDKLAKSMAWWDRSNQLVERLKEANLANATTIAKQYIYLLKEIKGFPRHLSQHVGGFLIARSPISTLVPIENAAMPDRTIIQWDKTDIESLGLLKIDVLALGMLTAIRKSIDLINSYSDMNLSVAKIPAEDPKTYAMLCRADTVGVFQVESRAQMSMLPRLRPKTFYDLVIQVAIVRPGPIQGDMVHPFLRRRDGEEPVTYLSSELEAVLKRTLGVPIFQEQVIKIAMVAAGFSGGEADALRRAMASWGKNGDLSGFREKLINGMLERGYDEDFAEQIFRQIQGFGEYGFPESHSASFALLAYYSAWLKCHYPAAFYCGLLNSLPMGFYSASQIVQDAKRHGVKILAIDVLHSQWDHNLVIDNNYPIMEAQPALRLGFRLVKGFNKNAAERIVATRKIKIFSSGHELIQRAQLNQQELSSIVSADALLSISGHRYQAHWNTQAIAAPMPLLGLNDRGGVNKESGAGQEIIFDSPSDAETTMMDYQSTRLTLNQHPMALLRSEKPFKFCKRATDLFHLNSGRFVRIAGLVTGRQRPGTASGVIFMTLEDETGNINVVIWKDLQQRFRKAIMTGRVLLIKGIMESKNTVIHVIAGEVIDCSDQLENLTLKSRDFH